MARSGAGANPRRGSIGTLVINLPDEVTKLPLRAAYNFDRLGLFNRIGAAVKYLVFGAPTLQKIVQ